MFGLKFKDAENSRPFNAKESAHTKTLGQEKGCCNSGTQGRRVQLEHREQRGDVYEEELQK